MPVDVAAWVFYASPAKFWFVTVLSGGLALTGFVAAFVFFYRSRLIEDMPTSRIRSAAQGYVELEGRGELMDGEPIVAPMSGTQCLWYRFTVEERRGQRTDGPSEMRWETIGRGVSGGLFVLVEGQDRCVIDPDGAIVKASVKDVWYANSYPPPPRLPGKRWGTGQYRYREERLMPGAQLYALGYFSSVRGAEGASDTRHDVADLLRRWKADRTTLLQRFDANGDGQIDLQEWEQARLEAEQQVRQHHIQHGAHEPTHLLARPLAGNRPFILSAVPQHRLVLRYRWSAAGSFLGFLLLGSLAVWLLTLRLTVGGPA